MYYENKEALTKYVYQEGTDVNKFLHDFTLDGKLNFWVVETTIQPGMKPIIIGCAGLIFTESETIAPTSMWRDVVKKEQRYILELVVMPIIVYLKSSIYIDT